GNSPFPALPDFRPGRECGFAAESVVSRLWRVRPTWARVLREWHVRASWARVLRESKPRASATRAWSRSTALVRCGYRFGLARCGGSAWIGRSDMGGGSDGETWGGESAGDMGERRHRGAPRQAIVLLPSLRPSRL